MNITNIFSSSFDSRLNSIKDSFQSAHDKTAELISKMNEKISKKNEKIVELQSEIKDIEVVKEQANKFITNLKGILA